MEPITHHPLAHASSCRARTSTPTRSFPARFLRTTTREGLGKQLFSDWRYDADGSRDPDFVLNQPGGAGLQRSWSPAATSAAAPRASTRPGRCSDFGFRAVISTEIADIFRSNSLKNGLRARSSSMRPRSRGCSRNPGAEVTIDLESTHADAAGRRAASPFPSSRSRATAC